MKTPAYTLIAVGILASAYIASHAFAQEEAEPKGADLYTPVRIASDPTDPRRSARAVFEKEKTTLEAPIIVRSGDKEESLSALFEAIEKLKTENKALTQSIEELKKTAPPSEIEFGSTRCLDTGLGDGFGGKLKTGRVKTNTGWEGEVRYIVTLRGDGDVRQVNLTGIWSADSTGFNYGVTGGFGDNTVGHLIDRAHIDWIAIKKK